MAWPTPSDYQDAVQNPASCFSDPRLRSSQPALGPLGLPKVASGNYCSVYQMRSGRQRWAVRCFNRQVPDAERRYRTIDEHLNRHPLPWFVGFDYLNEGIRIHGRWYPIVTMDWVEGLTLSRYLEERLVESAALRALADQWPQVMADLRGAGIAHGDLQHGNVLVAGETFRLVDYDNLYVPAFRGEPSPELGRLHYQHPGRTGDDFDLEIGNFSGLVIYLSLRALAVDRSLWRFYNGENLVLTADDYRRPAASPALARMRQSPDPLVPALAAELARICALPVSRVPPLQSILASLGVASPVVASAPPPSETARGAPGWMEPSPPAPSRGRPAATSRPASPPGEAESDPWWEETAPAAPVPAPPGRPRAGRPGWLSSRRAAPTRRRSQGAVPAPVPRRPAIPVVSTAGCVASLARSCFALILLSLLALASTGWWLYQNWDEYLPLLFPPPASAPQGGERSVPPADAEPAVPGEPPGPPSRRQNAPPVEAGARGKSR